MKMMLSTPSTISSAESVAKLIQASGEDSSSNMRTWLYPRPAAADAPGRADQWRNTPQLVVPVNGFEYAADREIAITVRVSRGSMIPSSHSRAVE